MSDDGIIALIDLTDSEYNKAVELGARITMKYQGRTANQQNLMNFNAEIVGRFRDEMDLEVTLDLGRRIWSETFGMVTDDQALLAEGPTITIEGRTEKEFDLERAVAEAKKGIADPLFEKVKAREAARAPGRKLEIAKGSEEVRRARGDHPLTQEGHPHKH